MYSYPWKYFVSTIKHLEYSVSAWASVMGYCFGQNLINFSQQLRYLEDLVFCWKMSHYLFQYLWKHSTVWIIRLKITAKIDDLTRKQKWKNIEGEAFILYFLWLYIELKKTFYRCFIADNRKCPTERSFCKQISDFEKGSV